MWGFPLMFWMVVLLIYFVAIRPRRRWRRQCHWQRLATTGAEARPLPRVRDEARLDVVDALESRIAELEERLDFTERLLAGRQATPPSR